MTRAFGFLTVIIAGAIGVYLYMQQMEAVTPGTAGINTAIDVTGVRNDLTAMAQAEKRYWAVNARYATLEELRKNGDIHIPTRETYTYSVDAGENNFTIVATYNGSDPKAPMRITVDETMSIVTR